MFNDVHWQEEPRQQELQKTKLQDRDIATIRAANVFTGRAKHYNGNGVRYSTNEFSFACFTNKHLLIRCTLSFLVSHQLKLQTIKFNPKYPKELQVAQLHVEQQKGPWFNVCG
jgi:hypothetical protein